MKRKELDAITEGASDSLNKLIAEIRRLRMMLFFDAEYCPECGAPLCRDDLRDDEYPNCCHECGLVVQEV